MPAALCLLFACVVALGLASVLLAARVLHLESQNEWLKHLARHQNAELGRSAEEIEARLRGE